MEALRLEDFPEVQNRITIVEDKNGKKVELKNKRGKVSVLNPDRCIGCGVCAYKCPTKSLILERSEVIQDTPKNAREYIRQVMADFAAGRAQSEPKGNK